MNEYYDSEYDSDDGFDAEYGPGEESMNSGFDYKGDEDDEDDEDEDEDEDEDDDDDDEDDEDDEEDLDSEEW